MKTTRYKVVDVEDRRNESNRERKQNDLKSETTEIY